MRFFLCLLFFQFSIVVLSQTESGNNLGSLDLTKVVFAEIEKEIIYNGDVPISIEQNSIIENYYQGNQDLAAHLDLNHLENQKEVNDSLKSALVTFFDRTVLDSIQVFSNCYMPRHGILIYDSNNELEMYIEICFECHGMYTVSKNNLELKINYQDYGRLKEFFIQQGFEIE